MSLPYRVTAYDWFLFAILVVAWGSSFVMSKLALQHVDPAWIAASRLVIGAGVLALFALFESAPLPRSRRDVAGYVWLGLIGNAAPFFIITWAMQFISSGVAGLLMGTVPLFVIGLAHFVLPGERLTVPRGLGFALGFLGIVILLGPQNLLNIKLHGQELIGELAIIVACIMYGINAVSVKALQLKGSMGVSAAVLAAGAVIATPAAIAQAPFTVLHQPAASIWALVGLGLIPTGLATVVWFKAVERTSPTFTTMSNYLVPVYALAFGAITLGEQIGFNALLALGFILAGIFVSRLSPRSSQ
jgi:drug/metabolite transporter (DMT)-like permease